MNRVHSILAALLLFISLLSADDAVADLAAMAEGADSLAAARVEQGIAFTYEQDSVMVVVDGGEAVLAPDTLGLSAGAHSILFKKKGHYKKKITLTVPADSILEQAVVLRAPAVLLIDAGVDSARVLINKKPVGRTPFRSKPLRPGSYDIMIVKSGYERYTATVTLGSGEEETLAVALKSTAPIVDTSVVETEKTTPDTLPNAPKKESPREKKIARAIAGAVFTLFIGMIAAFEISNGGE